MIKVDEYTVEIKGKKVMVETELSALIHSMYTQHIMGKDEIMEAVELGFKTEDELRDDAKKKIGEILDLLNEIVKGGKKDE